VCCLCVLFGTFSTVSVTSEKRQSIVGFEMFKKFIREENVISNSQVKSSVARGIRSSLVGQMHDIGEVIDDIIPKKTTACAGEMFESCIAGCGKF